MGVRTFWEETRQKLGVPQLELPTSTRDDDNGEVVFTYAGGCRAKFKFSSFHTRDVESVCMIDAEGAQREFPEPEIQEWVYRLAKPGESTGFQYFSAQHLRRHLEKDEQPLDPQACELVASVLRFALNNSELNAGTRGEVAATCAVFGRLHLDWETGMFEVLASATAEAALTPSGSGPRALQHFAEALVRLFAKCRHSEPSALFDAASDLVLEIAATGADVSRALALLAPTSRDPAIWRQALARVGEPPGPGLPNVAETILVEWDRIDDRELADELFARIVDLVDGGALAPSAAIVKRLCEAAGAHHEPSARQRVVDLLDRWLQENTLEGSAETAAVQGWASFAVLEETGEIFTALGGGERERRLGLLVNRRRFEDRPVADLAGWVEATASIAAAIAVPPFVELVRPDVFGSSTSTSIYRSDLFREYAQILGDGHLGAKQAALRALAWLCWADIDYKSTQPCDLVRQVIELARGENEDLAALAVQVLEHLVLERTLRRSLLVYENRYNQDHDMAKRVVDELRTFPEIDEETVGTLMGSLPPPGPGRKMSHYLIAEQNFVDVTESEDGMRAALCELAAHDSGRIRSCTANAISKILKARDFRRPREEFPLAAFEDPTEREPLLDALVEAALRAGPDEKSTERVALAGGLAWAVASFENIPSWSRAAIVRSVLCSVRDHATDTNARPVVAELLATLQRMSEFPGWTHGELRLATTALLEILELPLLARQRAPAAVSFAQLLVRGTTRPTAAPEDDADDESEERAESEDVLASVSEETANDIVDALAAQLTDPDLEDRKESKLSVLESYRLLLEAKRISPSRLARTAESLGHLVTYSPHREIRVEALRGLHGLFESYEAALTQAQRVEIFSRFIDVAVFDNPLDTRLQALTSLADLPSPQELRSRLIATLRPTLTRKADREYRAGVLQVFRRIGYSIARERARSIAVKLAWTLLGTTLGYLSGLLGGIQPFP